MLSSNYTSKTSVECCQTDEAMKSSQAFTQLCFCFCCYFLFPAKIFIFFFLFSFFSLFSYEGKLRHEYSHAPFGGKFLPEFFFSLQFYPTLTHTHTHGEERRQTEREEKILFLFFFSLFRLFFSLQIASLKIGKLGHFEKVFLLTHSLILSLSHSRSMLSVLCLCSSRILARASFFLSMFFFSFPRHNTEARSLSLQM